MTIWHQRLIKFLARILGVVVILAIIGLFLFYALIFKKDNLIKYVPSQAVMYVSLRLDENLSNNNLVKKVLTSFGLESLPVEGFNPLIQYNGAFAIIPQEGALAFDYLVLVDLRDDQAINTYLDKITQAGWHYDWLNINTLQKKILVLSNSQQVVQLVRQVKNQQAASLVQNIDVVYNLQQLPNDKSGKVYINVAALAKYLSSTDYLSWKLGLASLVVKDINDLYLSLENINNQLLIKTPEYDNSAVLVNPHKLPQDFQAYVSIQDAQAGYLTITKLLEIIDKQAANDFKAKLDAWQNNLGLDLSKDVLPYFSRKTELIKTPNGYILGLELAKEPSSQEQRPNIEALLLKYVSFMEPVNKSKQLPDYTSITQVIKNPNAQFVLEDLANFSLKSLQNTDLKLWDEVYNNTYYLANSRQLLIDYINNRNFTTLDLAESDNALILNQTLINQYLPSLNWLERVIINDNLGSGKNIRLILE